MKNSLCKAQYVLLVLFLFALSACGTSSTLAPKADGKIAASLVYKDSTGKSVGLVAGNGAQVTKTRLVVTGPDIPTAKKLFDGNTGGTIEVYPGSKLIVTALAYDSTGALVYEGAAVDQTIASGETKNLTIQLNPPVIKAEDQSCLGCHESTRDITGQNLIADYKQSGHYSNEFWTLNQKNGSKQTGCAGCHGTQHNDLSPAESGRCFECHGSLGARHTKAGTPLTNARYLSPANNNCSACHEPHNPLYGAGAQERKDWAASGHGDVNALPWMDYDFTTRATCNACHTPSGFVQAIDSAWANTAVIPNTAMQPLTCDGCHSSNDFKNSVRTISGDYKAGMGGYGSAAVATVTYQNVGESNICIPCHASRENGQSIIKTVTDYSNVSFKNPHYLGASAVFYGKGGFQFYSSTSQTQYAAQAYTSKYGVVVDGTIIKTAIASTSNSTPAIAVGDVMVGEKAPWSHGKLGMNNFQTTKTAAIVAEKGSLVYTGTKGQCVACHLGPQNTHSFDALAAAEQTWTTNYKGCYGCHTNENMTVVAEEEKLVFDASMAFFKWQLGQVGAVYSDAYPYFYNKATTPAALKNWIAADTAVGMVVPGGTGAANMGAAMNYKLLTAEKGAHVHNRTFMKQMIFDSIQYLQKGAVTFTNRYVATGAQTDVNNLISFTSYSTAVTPAGGGLPSNGVSIYSVKGYITRKNTGTNGAIGSAATPLYTRP